MKKIIYLLLCFIVLSCNTEGAWDCIQSSGEIQRHEYKNLDSFNKILIFKRVKLIFRDGPVQKVFVETGKNLFNEIRVRVEDSILKVSDRNSCNLVRENVTKVFVMSPNIEEIQNSSGLTVESIGEIKYENLTLIAVDPEVDGEFQKNGDFKLDSLNVGFLGVSSNGVSRFYLKGKAFSCNFNIADGDVRVDASQLETKKVEFFHRSTNQIIVKPSDTLRGIITSLGDVICLSRPTVVEVEERYEGALIFE